MLDFEQADVISLQGTGQQRKPWMGTAKQEFWDNDRMPTDRTTRLLVTVAVLAGALVAAGCSTQVADMALPSDAPPRPREAGTYLPVHDLPQARDEATPSLAEQKRLAKELIDARDRQASAATPAPAPASPPAKKKPATTQ